MRLSHFFLNESFNFEKTNDISPLHSRLIDLDILIEHILKHKEKIWADINLYDVEIIKGKSIVDWVYGDQNNDGMDDLRWMLRRVLEIAQSCEMSEYSYLEVKSKIEEDSPVIDTTLICLSESDHRPMYIHNTEKWRVAHKYYLQFCYDEQSFIARAELCFENLFFHERVIRSMSTLSAPLNEYTTEIIEHLTALNNEAPVIYREYHQNGDQSMLERLSVIASPERKPEIVRKQLTFDFTTDNGHKVPVSCSQHTKLNGQMRKGNAEYLFDRIYFNWGNQDIQNGKILIAHIGQHRK